MSSPGASPLPTPEPAQRGSSRSVVSLPLVGLLVGLTLMSAAMLVPALAEWNVHVKSFPPLHAEWMPRIGPGTVPAIVIAAVGAFGAVRWAEAMAWRWLLLTSYVVGLAWMLSLAYVDGRDGVGVILDTAYEYMNTARATTDLPATLEEYVSRIGFDAGERRWPPHLAGHPAGALVFFVVLVRLGVDTGFGAGVVVTLISATTALAVLQTLRTLGAEAPARRAAPFLVLGPAAIWQCVSADGVFAAVVAWGALALAVAATRTGRGPMAAWAVLAGALLGYAVMMSYGLPLAGILALAVLWLGRSWRPLPWAFGAACLVGLTFAAYGFAYWEALPAIHERYWDGVAAVRPASYWLWGNLAALLFSAGPMAAAGLGQLMHQGRAIRRSGGSAGGFPATAGPVRRLPTTPSPLLVVWTLTLAGWLMVVAADLSRMSKAEVERIWLPFVPWVLLGCALLPERWRRAGLVVQLLAALLVQHLLRPDW